jgi:hypothetical protein
MSTRRWTTSAGLMLAGGMTLLFAVLSVAYVLTLIYAANYTTRGALSMVLPIPAIGVLMYVIAAGVLNSVGIATSKPTHLDEGRNQAATI